MKPINTLSRFLAVLLLLIGCAYSSTGQRVPKSITKRDERNIRSAAEQTVGNLVNLLNTVADPGNSTADLDDAIANAFNADSRVRIFFQNDFEADDDLDPSIPADESLSKDIKAYLRQFRNFYFQNKPLSIRYNITEISEIHIGEANLYLKVYFNQLMNGKDRKDNAFPSKMPKVAEMQILSIGGQWQTLVSHLDRQSKADRQTNTPVVTISDAGANSDNDLSVTQHSPAYYRNQLQKGIRLLSENNYTEAFYAFKEAKRFGETEAEADMRIKEMMSRMRGQNIEPTEYLFDGLNSRALNLQDKYRYTLARNYYNYAMEVRPAAAKNVATALLALSQIQSKQQQLLDLLDKSAYNEAVKGFSSALQKEPYNPTLHVGLARAYAGLGQSNEAEEEFTAAIKADPSFPETYRWRGSYYKDRKDYRQAYDAFANYQTRSDDSGDVYVLSDLAFCRGKLAQLQNNVPLALEEYNSALQYNPENKEVLIAQADLLRTQGDKGIKAAKKLIDDALRRDDKSAEAYAVKARIFESEVNKAAAADAYQSAIKYDKDNPRWYYELGKLQMELNDKTDNAAILTFTSCMNIRTSSREDALLQVQALWKRGKCYYLQNRNDEAEADYNAFRQKAKMLSTPFNVDYANLLIKKAKYDEAAFVLKQAGEKPEALLSMGILNYTRYPSNEASYADYFTRAFRDGVSQEVVKNAPNMRMVYENCGLVKSLVKKFKYDTDF
jgi:tetratricopeptide (TPR) repeat protein